MHTLKTGDTIKIRNNSGLLNVTLLEKLNMRNVTLGIHDEIGEFKNLRLEFHERYGEKIITLYDQYKGNEIIFLIFKEI